MDIRAKTINVENDPYVLPSDNNELQAYILKYKTDMTEQVISSIEFALKHSLPVVEIFQFKGSKFVVTVSPQEFDQNLENIYKYYLETEKYELCSRVFTLQEKLKKTTNEKTKKSINTN
jgi:hypothetical protein